MRSVLKFLSLLLCLAFITVGTAVPAVAATDSAEGGVSESSSGLNSGSTSDPAVPTAVLTVQSDFEQVCPGDTVTVTLSVSENSGIVSGAFTLSYDSTKLTYVSSEVGTLLGGGLYAIDALASSVVLTRAPAEGLAPLTASGSLLILRFTAKEGTEGQTLAATLSVSDVKGANGELNLNLEQKASFFVSCKVHDYEGEPVVVGPNCLIAKTSTQYCKRCKKDIVTELSPALGHSWGGWNIVTPATCSAAGSQTRTCGNPACPVGTETEVIPPLPHIWAPDMPIVTLPTCLLPGSGIGTCTVCTVVQAVELPALGHAQTEVAIIVPATCVESGYANTICSRCMNKQSLILPPTGHNVVEWVISDEVKCMQPGVRKGTCQNCQQQIEEYLDQMAHVYGSPVVLKPATETEFGEQQVTCSRCGETTLQLIPPIVIDPITGLPVTTDGSLFFSSGGSFSGVGSLTTDGNASGLGQTNAGAGTKPKTPSGGDSGIDTWVVFVVGGGMLLLICAALILFFLLKKKIDGDAPSDTADESASQDPAGTAAVVLVSEGETASEPEESERSSEETPGTEDAVSAAVAAAPVSEESAEESPEDPAEAAEEAEEDPAETDAPVSEENPSASEADPSLIPPETEPSGSDPEPVEESENSEPESDPDAETEDSGEEKKE